MNNKKQLKKRTVRIYSETGYFYNFVKPKHAKGMVASLKKYNPMSRKHEIFKERKKGKK